MKRTTSLRSLTVLIVGLLLSMCGTLCALADPPEAPNFLGHWTGMYRSAVDPTVLVPIDLQITKQHKHRFAGTARLGPINVGAVQGVYFRKGDKDVYDTSFNVHTDGLRFRSHVNVIPLGDVSGMQGSYTLGPPGNPIDQGNLICVQSLGGEGRRKIVGPAL
jgi:hypothetical protein